MKPLRTLLLLLIAAMVACPGARAQEPLLSCDALEAELLSAASNAGEATLTLKWANHTADEATILLFAPMLDGEPASFRYGWASEELRLPPSSKTESVVTLHADDPQLLARTLSLRFIQGDRVSGRAIITLAGGGTLLQAASFNPEEEPRLVQSAIPWDTEASPLLLTDALSPEQVALLDYGQLRICLRRTVDGQEELIPFAAIPAAVTEDGQVTAPFSGYAVVCSAASSMPLRTQETHADGLYTYAVGDIALSGPFIFYATLQLTVTANPQAQEATLTQLSLDSPDAGCLLQSPPLCLFDTLTLSMPVYRAAQRESAYTLASTDVLSTTLPVETPLTFQLVPASTLGELSAYFEYFFLDQTDVIHPAFPLN